MRRRTHHTAWTTFTACGQIQGHSYSSSRVCVRQCTTAASYCRTMLCCVQCIACVSGAIAAHAVIMYIGQIDCHMAVGHDDDRHCFLCTQCAHRVFTCLCFAVPVHMRARMSRSGSFSRDELQPLIEQYLATIPPPPPGSKPSLHASKVGREGERCTVLHTTPICSLAHICLPVV